MASLVAPIAVTPGEPAGIGGEITLKAWQALKRSKTPFFLLDDPERIEHLSTSLSFGVEVVEIDTPSEAEEHFARALPVLSHPFPTKVNAGHPDPVNAQQTLSAIERAVEFVKAGEASALTTNPIQKEVLYRIGFIHPGHTEFLAALSGPEVTPVMMLACDGLRVVPVTIHISLSEVPKTLTTELIVETARITANGLVRDFGLSSPRLAIAGLNPHAGEGGSMGREEIDVIGPAIERLRLERIDVSGPHPADTLFHEEARKTYDVALGMYHDQVLVPIKTLDFWRGVNVTLGLPFIRTSPDHGTGLDIAGTGKAHAGSLVAALEMAESMAIARRDRG